MVVEQERGLVDVEMLPQVPIEPYMAGDEDNQHHHPLDSCP